jgi:hypothetical protein
VLPIRPILSVGFFSITGSASQEKERGKASARMRSRRELSVSPASRWGQARERTVFASATLPQSKQRSFVVQTDASSPIPIVSPEKIVVVPIVKVDSESRSLARATKMVLFSTRADFDRLESNGLRSSKQHRSERALLDTEATQPHVSPDRQLDFDWKLGGTMPPGA